ncbi:MAG: FAD-dependent oxidoreductase, partial [Chloroflexi bacterium]|nr:FAD-dependent oxidoreductase [Chloroflexota bacterium]
AFFPDGTVLIEPDTQALAEKAGLQTQATQPFYDVVIIGAGPAGLGAAVYAVTEGLRTVMIEREATGGQAGTSSRIENYLGFPNGISGADLARRATAQAVRFGAEILTAQEVTAVRVEGPYRIVTLGAGTELSCHALIVATGVSVRLLDIPGASDLAGAGVYYGAATTEAVNYRGHDVLVVGGANSAGQGAMFLSRYAQKVTMLVRSPTIEQGMSQYLVDQIASTENIDVVLSAEVAEVHGDGRLASVAYSNVDTGARSSIDADAMFVFIGAEPHTDLVAGLVERNEGGFILTGRDVMPGGKRPKGWTRDPYSLETSVPGIFAVGDVRQGVMRRVASAVGDGAIAISFVHQYLRTV